MSCEGLPGTVRRVNEGKVRHRLAEARRFDSPALSCSRFGSFLWRTGNSLETGFFYCVDVLSFGENSRFRKPDRRATLPQFTPEALAHNMPLVTLVRQWAERKSVTPAQFALIWMLSRKQWIVPIPGTTNPVHLDDFSGAAFVRMNSDELEEFDRDYAQISLMGHRADPFTGSQIDK